MLKERNFNIVVVDENNAAAFNGKNKGVSVRYNGEKQTVKI